VAKENDMRIYDGVEARAFRAYFRRFGEHAAQPSGNVIVQERPDKGEVVLTLGNVNGTLARYVYRPATDRLAYLPD
jgi:hypothetical protein